MLILSVSTIIVTSLIYRSNSAVPFVQVVLNREKALFVAQSGIAYVQALATFQPDIENKNQENKKRNEEEKQGDREIKTVITRLLPLLNRWTELVLQKTVDGIDGTIHLYVTSEEGKININTAYDFKKKAFIAGGQAPSTYIDDQKKLVMSACQLLEKAYKVTGLFEKLEKFLKTFDGPLNDISDLLAVPGFEPFCEAVFPNFLHDTEKQLYLADIFTVVGNRTKLNPWFLSRSVKQLCGIKEQSGEVDKENQKIDQLVKQFLRTVPDWEKEWKKIFAQKYHKTVQQLPKGILGLFDANCMPQFFTVISVGQVNNTSYSLIAFIEVIETRRNNQISYESRIKRWYVIE
jgi:hypothetical protein